MTSASLSLILPEDRFQKAIKIQNIFSPHGMQRRNFIYGNPKIGDNPVARFVHYTSAEAAFSVIKGKRIWMRNTNSMADYSEVQHGYGILYKFFSDETTRKEFIDCLDAYSPGAALEAINLFDGWSNDIKFNTFITSISEHDESEDTHGRLSMWRAFGGNTARVAVVLKIPWRLEASEQLSVIFSPVAYLSEENAHKELKKVIGNIRANGNFIESLKHEELVGSIFNMLLTNVVGLKHEGFHEEREWRVIYAPKRWPSKLIESSTEVLSGIPQIVQKIPLDSDILNEINLPRIFDRIIIGPTPYPWAMYQAFTDALREAGIEDAEARVFTSRIPIRS